MQSIAYQLRTILEAMEAYGNIHTLIIFGGAAKSSLWCQIIADITGMEVFVPTCFEAASAGAARLAAIGCGKDIGSLKCAGSYKPCEELREYYDRMFKKYIRIEKNIWEVK